MPVLLRAETNREDGLQPPRLVIHVVRHVVAVVHLLLCVELNIVRVAVRGHWHRRVRRIHHVHGRHYNWVPLLGEHGSLEAPLKVLLVQSLVIVDHLVHVLAGGHSRQVVMALGRQSPLLRVVALVLLAEVCLVEGRQ